MMKEERRHDDARETLGHIWIWSSSRSHPLTFQLYKAALKRQTLEGASCHTMHTCTEAMRLKTIFPSRIKRPSFLGLQRYNRQLSTSQKRNQIDIIVHVDDPWCPRTPFR